MEAIVGNIQNQIKRSSYRTDEIDLLFSENLRYQGIGLKNEILIYDTKKTLTFRLRLENAINKPFGSIKVFKAKDGLIDKEFLEEYFNNNQDNPFALSYIFILLANKYPLDKENVKTQFPPLTQKPTKAECEKKFDTILQKVQAGDVIFTYDNDSRVSEIIRQVDHSQWSHCGSMFDNKELIEMTTGGLYKGFLSELDPYKLDIAIYRQVDLNDRKLAEMKQRMEDSLKNQPKYNWRGILYAYLFRKYPRIFKNLRNKTGPTVSDLIFSNQFVLVDWV